MTNTPETNDVTAIQNLAGSVFQNITGKRITSSMQTEDLYPVIIAILVEIEREFMPDPMLLRNNGGVNVQISIDREAVNKTLEKISDREKIPLDAGAIYAGRSTDFEYEAERIIYSSLGYIIGNKFNPRDNVPDGLLYDRKGKVIGMALCFHYDELVKALDKLHFEMLNLSRTTAEKEKVEERNADIANIKAYVKMIHDKVNDTAATIDGFRKEVVTVLDTISFGVNKVLDIIIPEKVKKARAPKKGTDK